MRLGDFGIHIGFRHAFCFASQVTTMMIRTGGRRKTRNEFLSVTNARARTNPTDENVRDSSSQLMKLLPLFVCQQQTRSLVAPAIIALSSRCTLLHHDTLATAETMAF